jgi:endoglucanase
MRSINVSFFRSVRTDSIRAYDHSAARPDRLPAARGPAPLAACGILLLAVLGCGGGKSGTEPVPAVPSLSPLHTEGNRIVDSTGTPVLLHGVNRSGLEYDRNGNGISEAEIDFICSDWKARIVRVPFNEDWIRRDPDYMKRLDRVVEWISGNGAYALIDLHWQTADIGIPPVPDEEAVTMWATLAARYRSDPAVLYDIHNEAHDVSWPEWRSRASQIVGAVRAVHPGALVFVCGLDWAYDLRGWEAEPLAYPNVVYATHPYPFKAEPWAWDKYFGNAARTLPVFAGEFGGEAADIEWGRRLMEYLRVRGIGWTAWSWVDSPRLTQTDRRTPTDFGLLVKDGLALFAGGSAHALALWDVRVIAIGRDRATIQWRTDATSDSEVFYAAGGAPADSVHVPAMLESHTVKLTGLAPATAYRFRAESTDRTGVRAASRDSTFTTLP